MNSISMLGLAIIIGTIILAYVANYFLNVKRTTSGGAIAVKSFWDYIGFGLITVIVKITLSASILGGIGLFILGLIS